MALVVETLDPHAATPVGMSAEEFEGEAAGVRSEGFLDTWDRWQGIREGLDGLDVVVIVAGHNSRASGALAGPVILDRADRPTAVIAISDVLALGVIDALRARGLTPGREVSVAGFDDLPDLSERAGLTTIHQPIHDKGRLAAHLLLDPARQPRRITLPFALVVRSSTGPVPKY